MLLADLVMLAVAFIFVYIFFIRKSKKDEVKEAVYEKVSEYEEAVELTEKIKAIDQEKLKEAEEVIKNTLAKTEERQTKKEEI